MTGVSVGNLVVRWMHKDKCRGLVERDVHKDDLTLLQR